MRLCHVTPHLPPDQAANALLPAQLGAWATRRGHDVAYLAHQPAQGRHTIEDPPGRVLRIPSRRSASEILRVSKIDTWRRARRVLRALDDIATGADLLHLHSNGLIIEVAAAWARRRQVPYLLTVYGTEVWHYRPRWPVDPFTRAYRHARAVTFYSQRLLDRARTHSKLKRPDLSVIYPAVSEEFAPQGERTRDAWRRDLGIAEPLVILNVKRLHELAGQRFLIDAFARVVRRRHDVRLVICGTGPLRGELEDQARSLGVLERVTFTGLVSNAVVARYGAIADVFALPSLLEALPTVAVEALASGTPVVSADHPGGEELHALFGDDVQLVPRQRSDALADALADALTARRRTLPRTAALVHERFGQSAVEGAYFSAYDKALRD
jgi:glycosyltransferase involved in cell wall biosynthesis